MGAGNQGTGYKSRLGRVGALSRSAAAVGLLQQVLAGLGQPLREIARNAGDEPSVVIAKVLEGKGNFGYNAQTGEYGDMVAMGVLDPTKVTRYAL
jgi:chaperonin GroEL (HSP60 family)